MPEWLPALAAALTGPLTRAGTGQLQHHHARVLLREHAHHLPEGYPAWVIGHQVGLHDADDSEAVLPEVGERGLLNHEITRKAVQPLNEDRADAVRVERLQHLGEGLPVGGLDRAASRRRPRTRVRSCSQPSSHTP